MKKITFLVFAIALSYSTKAQVDPIKVIDAVAGTLLPKVVEGVKSIKDARNRDKDEKASELKEEFEKAQKEAVADARKKVISQIGKDIELLSVINQLQIKVERINNDVGALSIYKDVAFVDILKGQEAAVVKNQIIRKFFNSLEQIFKNRSDLGALRDQINTSDVNAAGKAAGLINQIVSKLDDIETSVNDCKKPSTGTTDSKSLNECLDVIKSVSTEIASLETIVGTLNSEVSAMLKAYIKGYQTIKDAPSE